MRHVVVIPIPDHRRSQSTGVQRRSLSLLGRPASAHRIPIPSERGIHAIRNVAADPSNHFTLPVACARMTVIVDRDAVGLAERPDVRTHQRNGDTHLRRRRFFFERDRDAYPHDLSSPKQKSVA